MTLTSIESQFVEKFGSLIDESIHNSPFFNAWTEDNVDAAKAKKFLATFEALVRSFPSLIALGAARATDADTRTVLAVNLYQECGEGDLQRTHHAIFRQFLDTANVDPTTAPSQTFTEDWRVGLLNYIEKVESPLAALGALAAGEFLAQPVLSRIFSVIEPLYPDANVEYFTTHLELETEHVEEVASLLARQVELGGSPDDIEKGFEFGLKTWVNYFDCLSEYVFDANVRSVGGQ